MGPKGEGGPCAHSESGHVCLQAGHGGQKLGKWRSGQKSAVMGPPGKPEQVNLTRPLSFGPSRSALQSWVGGRGPVGPGGDQGHELDGGGLAGAAVLGYLWGLQGPEGLGAYRGRGCRGRLIGILGGPVF